MAVDYPEVPGVEVLLNGAPLPRDQWERYAVYVSDLLDAKSGTRVTYGCNGTVTIQLESREAKAWRLVQESGRTVHSSDCATSCAPAMEPSACDCDEPQPTPD
jgi:hypothetical protein